MELTMESLRRVREAHWAGVEQGALEARATDIWAKTILRDKHIHWDNERSRKLYQEIYSQVSAVWGEIPKPSGFLETLAYQIGYSLL